MFRIRYYLILLIYICIPTKSFAEINVLASIQPIHSLVAMVMNGIGQPKMILEGTGSPHTYSLAPSKAREIQNADIVFWIGPQIETFLIKPLNNINKKKRVIKLNEIKNLISHKVRIGNGFEAHDHEHHDLHDDHKGNYQQIDQHFWLDPENAKLIIDNIELELSKLDPENANLYKKNATISRNKIDNLISRTKLKLDNFNNLGFIYFHDAFQYYEKRFGLNASGSISLSPEIFPGAKRIKELRKIINQSNVKCVFSEPQFEVKIISTVIEGTGKKAIVLDPLGSDIKPHNDLYFNLLNNITNSFLKCFK